jgi:protein-S-isoprenylcysteine O-methyltransferase Ste14
MVEARTAVRGTAWAIYAVLVLEILFLISPLAPLFYAFYGPFLRFLERHPETAWLTQFFLPHISVTANPVLNVLQPLGWTLLAAGTAFFLCSAVPLYWSMLVRRGQVVGGLYNVIRHPQYVGLAIMGFGVLLVWPRFLVLVSLIVMLGLYRVFAGTEESQCLARFGDSYRAYMARTGRFLPQALSRRLPRLLPPAGTSRVLVGIAIFAATLGLSIGIAFLLRNYALTQVAALYRNNETILSPARLTQQELETAYRTAVADSAVRAALDAAPAGNRLIYIVPETWDLPPVEERPAAAGVPHEPDKFDRSRFKLLFARARSHDPGATGPDVVKDAYGLDPIIVARVDAAARHVTVERPPAHVRWGDIPIPIY